MSDDEIDMDRVISDPRYRREVIEFLNSSTAGLREGELRPSERDAPAGS